MATQTLDKARAYTNVLEKYTEKKLISSVLDSANSDIIAFREGGIVEVPHIETTALGNYDRATGYPVGESSVKIDQLQLEYDRGRSFNVDAVDDMDTMYIRSSGVMKSFINEYVTPEIDGVRFMKYAKGALQKANGELTKDTVKGAINAAYDSLFQSNAANDKLYLFVNAKVKGLLEESLNRVTLNGDGNISQVINMYNDMQVITVPNVRFTADLKVNASGFTPGSNQINFLLVAPSAVRQIKKHEVIRTFRPEVNQDMDAWKFQYRIHHDAWVLPGRSAGVYVHSASEITE